MHNPPHDESGWGAGMTGSRKLFMNIAILAFVGLAAGCTQSRPPGAYYPAYPAPLPPPPGGVTNELPRQDPQDRRRLPPEDRKWQDGRPLDEDRRPGDWSDGGSTSGSPGAGPPGDRRTGGDRQPGRCDPRAADFAIGRLPSPDVVDEAVWRSGATTVRVIPFRGAATMDFSPTRLTIQLDRAGRIDQMGCN
jgi:hypothetical protein